MKKFIIKLWKIFASPEFLKFLLAGCVNTFNTSLFSSLFAYFIHDNISAALGYIFSLVIAYFINGKFVFHKPYSKKSFIVFVMSYIPNFIIYNIFCFITINLLDLPQFFATAIPVAVAGPVTFLIIKLFAFKDKYSEKNGETD